MKYKKQVSIIIPVYNAYIEFEECIVSVLKNTNLNSEINVLIINDNSSDKKIDKLLAKYKDCKNIKIISNDTNLGYTKTINLGINISNNDDVVLLNSDTIVSPGWLEGLVNTAFSDNNIGTVTAMSNNAGAFSFPTANIDNAKPKHTSYDEYAENIIKKTSPLPPVEVPTGSGFCMLIKNELIKDIGLFDEKLFSLGYGEENDFCMRAFNKGWKNVISTSSFVFHKRSASFGENKKKLSEEGLFIINRKYPNYNELLKKYFNSKEIEFLRKKADEGRRCFFKEDTETVQNQIELKYRNDIKCFKKLIKKSEYYVENWYLSTNPDVAESNIDPLLHYLKYGGFEGRDPGPNFSSSCYSLIYKDVKQLKLNPLIHYLLIGKRIKRKNVFKLNGNILIDKNKTSILLCAHTNAGGVYGAELSFIDLLKGLKELKYNIIATLPGIMNENYLNKIKLYSSHIFIFPYNWDRKNIIPAKDTINKFKKIIFEFNIKLVHCNSTVLLEPYIASRECGIKSITHAREIYENDSHLCKELGKHHNEIVKDIIDKSDFIIANSEFTAKYYTNSKIKVFTLYNTLQEIPQNINSENLSETFIITMISSNIPKKGIFDFIKVAEIVASKNNKIEFCLVGPYNKYIEELMNKQKEGLLSGNISFLNYTDNISTIIRKSSVILNLSHFQESFGRTVLEAMAFGRPVICYKWGALPELVEQGKNGFLVKFKDINDIADNIIQLYNNQKNLKNMEKEIYNTAINKFGWNCFIKRLHDIYREIQRD